MKKTITILLALVLLICTLCVGCAKEETTKVEYATPEIEAVVVTAQSYLARGSRIQYDDTRFSPGDAIPRVYRWQHSEKTPEEYTTQYYGYTNCAAFAHDVYLEALGYDVIHYTTASFIEAQSDWRAFRYYPNGEETEERKAELEQQYRDTLQPGDIIIIRYGGENKGNGHAMVYVGPEALADYQTTTTAEGEEAKPVQDIIHSSGSSYSYGDMSERFETSGSIRTMSVDDLFNPDDRRYVFNCVAFSIVRPLNTWQNGVPEKTQNRINNLQGVVAEKLSSHTSGMTVNPGDEMTFTFSMKNTNKTDVTLDICDRAPLYTTYVSGADAVEEGTLKWTLTIPAGETKTVSYTVRVNDDAPIGDYIHGEDGTVGGVDTDCPRVYIAKTLTETEQQSILSAVETLKESELTDIALADAIYAEALGTTDLLPDEFAVIDSDLYTDYYGSLTHTMLTESGYYSDMVVPTMYGGRYVAQLNGRWDDLRTRLPYPQDMMVGDLFVIAETADASIYSVYFCLGEESLHLGGGFTRKTSEITDNSISYSRFAILRPSMAMK